MPPSDLTHFSADGTARMVDPSEKPATRREAVAVAHLEMLPETLEALRAGNLPKGDAIATARVAGIQAAKRTAELIPMCHQLPLSFVGIEVEFEPPRRVAVRARAVAVASTGVEMEALVAASTAALTLYDFCKAVERSVRVVEIYLESKTGGKSGDYLVNR